VPDGYPAMKQQHTASNDRHLPWNCDGLGSQPHPGMFAWYAGLIWRFFFD
jgi:hypothetical protein